MNREKKHLYPTDCFISSALNFVALECLNALTQGERNVFKRNQYDIGLAACEGYCRTDFIGVKLIFAIIRESIPSRIHDCRD